MPEDRTLDSYRGMRSPPLELFEEDPLSYWNQGRTIYLANEELTGDWESDRERVVASVKQGQSSSSRVSARIVEYGEPDDQAAYNEAIAEMKERMPSGTEPLGANRAAGHAVFQVRNESLQDAETAAYEDAMLNASDACVAGLGDYDTGRYDTPFVAREEGIRLAWILEEDLPADDISHTLGVRTRELLADGYGHTSLHPENWAVTADDIKITDGADIYPLTDGDPTHLIFDAEAGRKMTVYSALTTVEKLQRQDGEAVRAFFDGLEQDLLAEDLEKIEENLPLAGIEPQIAVYRRI